MIGAENNIQFRDVCTRCMYLICEKQGRVITITPIVRPFMKGTISTRLV